MPLEIAFSEKSYRLICENMAIAERKFGLKVAERLKRRLADLRAANNVNDIIAGKPQVVNTAHPQQLMLELCDGYCLFFCANHNQIPLLTPNEINWSKVSRVKILRIEKYYD